MKKLIKWWWVGLLVLPVLVVFRAFFSDATMAWGDAPYFYPENLRQLLYWPLIWDVRNSNFGLPQSQILWLYLPTFIVGLFHFLSGFDYQILGRVIFLMPAIGIGLFGSWLLTGLFTADRGARVVAALFYGLSNQFLVLIDGGQIGVGLAYGLLPLVILLIFEWWRQGGLVRFLSALGGLFLISNIDVRVAAFVLIGAFSLNWVLKFSSVNLLKLVLLLGLVVLLDGFWVLPLLTNWSVIGFNQAAVIGSVSVKDALLLFNQHFPGNEFGLSQQPAVWFYFLPVILFSGLGFKNRIFWRLSLLLIISIFLTKGASEPLGQIYKLIGDLPLGSAFRDSSKFLITSFLFGSLILALLLDGRAKWWKILGYIWVLLLIWPAIMGQMTGVLAVRPLGNDYSQIYKHLESNPGFWRSIWFSEAPPWAFGQWGKELISANTMYRELPFNSLIKGDYDLFYFLHSPQLVDWFRFLGIKYAFFDPPQRQKHFTDNQLLERQEFSEFVESIPGFQRLDWTKDVKAYQISDTLPKIFSLPQVIITDLGGQIFQQLNDNNISVASTGVIFLNDGQTKPEELLNLPKEAAVFVKRDRSFGLGIWADQILPFEKSSRWGMVKGADRLRWRYELLKNGVDSNDLGFGREVAYSTLSGEKLEIAKEISRAGDYYLAFRSLESTQSGGLKVFLNNQPVGFLKSGNVDFSWSYFGPFKLEAGQTRVTFENLGGLVAMNSPLILDSKQFLKSEQVGEELSLHFSTIEATDLAGLNKLRHSTVGKVSYFEIDPTSYQLNQLQGGRWLIFTDHFDPGWRLTPTVWHFQIDGMVNGFFLGSDQPSAKLDYLPQRIVWQGLVVSGFGFLILIGVGVVITLKKRRQ